MGTIKSALRTVFFVLCCLAVLAAVTWFVIFVAAGNAPGPHGKLDF